MSSFLILVGSYTAYISTLLLSPGPSGYSLSYLTQTACGGSPSWVTHHPSNTSIVYATQELYYASGMIYSLVLNPSTGALTQISSISTGTPSNAEGTVYVQAISNGTALAAANYNAGSAFFVGLTSDATHFTGSGQLLQFTGHGPASNQASAHAHETIEYGNEILAADLGSDVVRRLTNSGGAWSQVGSVTFTPGSAPRHMVATTDGNLYTLHQNYNVLTQNTLPSLTTGIAPQLIANISIIPPDTTGDKSNMQAGELIYAESPSGCGDSSPLLYASNRNDPSQSDAITVFETTPTLRAVAYVRTGLQHLRGMAFVGSHQEYIVVGGMNGGGIKVYKRVSSCQGYLTEIAALPAGQVSQPTGFTWALKTS